MESFHFAAAADAKNDVLIERFELVKTQRAIKQLSLFPRIELELVKNILYCNGTKLQKSTEEYWKQIPSNDAEVFASRLKRLILILHPRHSVIN
jgi:hypothetical protein